MMDAAALSTEGVTVAFGGHVALVDVDIAAEAGRVTGLIGPNGAGKTTMFNAITGVITPSKGKILLHGRDISRLDTYKRARLGIGRTFQRLELFTGLSVRDNLKVGGEIRNTWAMFAGRSHRVEVQRDTDRLVDLLGLTDVADKDVADIPTGTARVVELGRALMTRPRVLLLDEPASGQTEEETKTFGQLLRQLARNDGLAILLVEHDMALVMDICDNIHVLDFGTIIATGLPEEVRNDPLVLEAYLGSKGST